LAEHVHADAARAMRLVRSHAKEWNVDPSKIGFAGFSAGGEVAGMIETKFDAGKPDLSPTIAFEDEPVPSRHRRVRVGAALAAVAAAAVVVGMLVAGSGDHEPRVQLGAGSATTAAPTVPTTPTTTAADGLVAVPNVVGMRFSEASLSLSRVGLQAVFRYEASARPAGEVTGWEPADGRVPPGSTITLVVSG